MKRFLVSTIVLIGAVAASAQTPPPAAPKKAAPPAATAAPATPPGPVHEQGIYAYFTTSMGNIVAKLYDKEAPLTVANFTALARGTKAWMDPKTHAMAAKPLYNGVTFHRVIPNFMIQTGDPTGTGSHDCGFTIKDENNPTLLYDRPGRLGMANRGSPNSGGCQFFITQKAYPSLNGGYPIFGQVIEGQEVVDKIAVVPTSGSPLNKPITAVVLRSVVVKREGYPAAAPAPPKKAVTPAPTATKTGAPAAAPAKTAPASPAKTTPATPTKKQ